MEQRWTGTHFATLKPVNILAKVAFSEVFEACLRDRQTTQTTTPTASVLTRMQAGVEQEYHRDVLLFRLEMQRQAERQRSRPNDTDNTDSPTDPDTETEADNRRLGMIWEGAYIFVFSPAPSVPDLGWTAGKGPNVDLLLSTRPFAKQHDPKLKSFHARFNFDRETAAFFITKLNRSTAAELTVNGVPLDQRMCTLNQHRMNIRISSLEYAFQYSEFSSSKNYKETLREYLAGALEAPIQGAFHMPTLLSQTRTIGPWTLHDPLGKGAVGKVFLASNSRNEVVAVKVMERNSKTAGSVDKEISVLRMLTKLAEDQDDEERLVRLKDTLYTKDAATLPGSAAVFEEVALVLVPMTPQTFDYLVGGKSKG